MPFICLANANVPDGVVQITDLWPNVSQQNNAVDPPGQSRYLRRAATHRCQAGLTSGLVEGFQATSARSSFEGLQAYLLDKVEPGGLAQAAADITLVAPGAGDRVVVKGIIFQFAAGANDLVGKTGTDGNPFLVGLGASANAAAANLTLALNNAGDVIPAMILVATAGVHVLATNPGAPSAVVNIVAVSNPGAVLVDGNTGDLSLATNDVVNVLLPAAGRMSRTNERWTAANLSAAGNALQARVDAGTAMTLAAVDVVLLAQAGATLTATGGTASVGTLAELLSVLAGRTYRLPVSAAKFTAAVAPDTTHVWSVTLRGSFTTPVTVFDTQMVLGEIGPVARWVKHGNVVTGGDIENFEIGGVRSTIDTTQFQNSLQAGQLADLAAGVTLFPDNDVVPFIASTFQKGPRTAAIAGARVVTVFGDDGALLV